jgi:hypothetical protein
LSIDTFFKKILDHQFNIHVATPLFYFNRIKSQIESQGHGTVMMKRLVQICDENNITVINELNPYGRMDMKELQAWLGKYDFEEIVKDNLMIRYPKSIREKADVSNS